MKRLLSIIILFISFSAKSQQGYWQQNVDYIISVSLDDKLHTLDAFEKITYTNNSPDTLKFIWFHVWPNAFKNDKTAFTDQQLQNGNTKFYFSLKKERGYINGLAFKADGLPAKIEDHPNHIDILKVVLPKPLPPKQQTTITTPFHVKLPFNFSRGGYNENSFQITQWYPKPAVYDARGWHEMPYLDQGEFYSEYGSFDVRITLPKEYVVAATGELQNDEERKWLLNKAAVQNVNPKIKKDQKKWGARTPTKKTSTVTPVNAGVEMKTIKYLQNNVHDFAWFADKSFIVNYDTCVLQSGRTIDVFTYYTPAQKKLWLNSTEIAKDAIRFYSSEVGEYPYNIVSAVQGPQGFGGGMEYPTITLIAPAVSKKQLDIVLAHEIGHNWFYGILGSNEREHPWMDEGINSFYEYKYTARKYGVSGAEQDLLLKTKIVQKLDQPITTPSEEFSLINYGLVTYHKTAKWLQLIEEKLSEQKFKVAMNQYFNTWKYKHPQPDDFKAVFTPLLQEQTEGYFSLLHKKGNLSVKQQKGWKLATPLTLKNYIQNPTANLLFISPTIGTNRYEGFMLGAGITNYKLPPSRLQFLFIPLYGTESKKLSGLADVNYSIFPEKTFQQIRFSLGAMMFSKRASLDTNNNKVFERFERLTPSVRFIFKEGARSTRERSVELKSFLIKETNFDKFVIKSTDNLTYIDSLKDQNRYVNQISFTQANVRALYPYDYQFQFQQGEAFYRLNFTSNYFFNYADGGGMNMRLFAGKFGYIGGNEDRFSTFLYQPKLLGVTGEEDFTYSNYFVGRTASASNSDEAVIKNKGLGSHQIMIRDGAFKLRFDQYEFLQGRSEKWVAASNFTSSIPKKILPIPLKLFLDIGTHAEAWDSKATISRFLYVGGVQLSILNNFINIYAPLVYSNEFKEYIKIDKLTFFKRLSFSIDLQQLQLKKLTKGALSL